MWTFGAFGIHLLHATHLQVNLDVFGTSLFFLDVHDVCQRQQIKLRFSAKLRLHVFWSCMTFFNKFVENVNEFGCLWKEFGRVFGNGWWIRTCRIHPTVWNVLDVNGRELVFAPRPFQDGTAERRRHSTVHVHDRLLSWPVFLCGKGSKDVAVRAVFSGFVLCFYTLDAVEAAPIK